MGLVQHKEREQTGTAEMTRYDDLVNELLAADKVVIFSKTTCPYCKMAKEQFEKLSIPISVIELDKRDDGRAIQDALKKKTSVATVPQCFIDEQFIGGGTDVKRMYESGDLQKLVA